MLTRAINVIANVIGYSALHLVASVMRYYRPAFRKKATDRHCLQSAIYIHNGIIQRGFLII